MASEQQKRKAPDAAEGEGKKSRKDEASTMSAVHMRTVMRWRGKEGLNVDHILGANESATVEERARAEQVLTNTGYLVCIICAQAVGGNKKTLKRHQTTNKTHQLRLEEATRTGTPITTDAAMAVQVPLPYVPTGLVEVVAGSGTVSRGVAEAWEIVKNPSKTTDFASLSAILETLGCYDAKDLSYCSSEELESLAVFLKKVPQRNFYKVFGIEK